jgi:hypothetical protein
MSDLIEDMTYKRMKQEEKLDKIYEELAKEVGKIKPDLVSRSEIISSTETKVKIEYKNGK